MLRKWYKRCLSLMLSLAMVLGLMQTNLTAHAAELDEKQYLDYADGIVWLTSKKNANGSSDVSDIFMNMVMGLKLDDMVREALGIDDDSANVYFNDVNIGSFTDIMQNMSMVESLEADMREAVSNQFPVEFTVEGRSETQYVAFRNLTNATISVNGDNKIYVARDSAPADADMLKTWIEEAMGNATVSVEHAGSAVTAQGIKNAAAKARYEGSDFVADKNQSYDKLVEKWPTLSGSSEYFAGKVTVTVYAAEYSVNPIDSFKKEISVDVYLVDAKERAEITVKAEHVSLADGMSADNEVAGYEYFYQAYVGDAITADALIPKLGNYTFSGWQNGVDGTVPAGGATYIALMQPKVDLNKNGWADQNEKYTITYQDANGEVIAEFTQIYGESTMLPEDGALPEGYEWKTLNGGSWRFLVSGSITYKATEIEEIEIEEDDVIVPYTLLNGGSTVESGQLIATKIGESDKYIIEDQGWDIYLTDDGLVGDYYTIDSEGNKESFTMHDGQNCPEGNHTCTQFTADDEFTLFYDVYRVNEEGIAVGTVDNPIYVYEFNVAGDYPWSESYAQHEIDDLEIDWEDINPEYGVGDKYKYFDGWDYNNATITQKGNTFTYHVEPKLIDIDNSPILSEYITETVFGPDGMNYDLTKYQIDENTLRYIWRKPSASTYSFVPGETTEEYYYQMDIVLPDLRYTAEVKDEHGNVIVPEDIDFILADGKEISVSPIWKVNSNTEEKIMYGYVTDISWANADMGEEYAQSISLRQDADKNAYTDEAFATNDDGRSINLYFDYYYIQLDTKEVIYEAGQSYTREEVYADVITSNKQLDDHFAIEYLARPETEVTVDLYRLHELFDTEGLGVIMDVAGSLLETYTTTLPEKWVSIDESPEQEMTAQEVVDAYLTDLFENQKKQFVNIEEFALKFFGNTDENEEELYDILNKYVEHQFGYVAPDVAVSEDEPESTEVLRITYDSEEIYIRVKQVVNIDDNRDEVFFNFVKPESKDVTTLYNDSVGNKVLDNVVLSAADATGAIITMDGNSARDYSNAGSGVYEDVIVMFKGDETYRPAVSAPFALTVKKVEPTVNVEELIAVLKGNDYYERAAADVSPDAPMVQIVAGVSASELKLDESLALADDKVVVDAWVKLRSTWIELLDGLDLGTVKGIVDSMNLGELNGVIDGVTLTGKTIQAGVYYEKEHLEDVLEKYIADGEVRGADQIKQIQKIMDAIPDRVLNRLGVNDLNYTLRIRFDALEDEVYPTDSGFYVNYAATSSRFLAMAGKVDENYGIAEDYGFIVISPMVPIPNRGGVQLYDGTISNAQNVFVYEYNGEKIKRDLEVAVNGMKLDGEEPFYYGLTTRFDETKQVPTMPGVYFAGYNYTTEVLNEDTQEMEVRRLGSDSAIIIIKQQEADLEIKGGTYEHDGENHIAEVIVTDKDGNVIKDKGVTVISGTVNANVEGTNVTLNDLYGTVNVDFPDALQNKWDEYCNRIWGEDAKDKFTPSDVISFLEECGDAAEAEANKAIEEFKALAINDTVSAALDKINGKQNKVDVSSGNLINKAERIQHLMQGGKAYYDKLIAELEPLKNLDDNVWITFYDLATESAKLDYSKTGYYLYAGVITDPDLTVGVGKALVIIHSEDDYIMRDTHVPYDGQQHDIYTVDETKRGDVTAILYPAEDGVVAINREKKEVRIQVDNELAQVICDALNLIFEKDLNVNSDVYVGTVYTKTGNAADELTEKIMNVVKNRAVAKITADYPQAGALLDKALAVLDAKLDVIYDELLAKLQELDQLDNGTKIVISDLFSFDLGTYEVTTFDFDVNEINIQLDGDAFEALKTALAKKGYQLNEGSDGYVITGYEKFEDAADVITEAVFAKITDMANAAFDKTPYDTPKKLEMALEILENKILALKDRFSAKMQQIDGLDNYTRIVINGKLPVEVGTYNFYGYDYDVSATRGKLVIEPIYILVEDEPAWKYVGDEDPELTATVSYYSYEGVAPETVKWVKVSEEKIPNTADELVSYNITRDEGEEIGKYDISIVDLKLLDNSGNYKLLEREEDKEDFEIHSRLGTISKGIWKMDLDSVVYLNYYPVCEGFAEDFDFSDPERAGVILWTGEEAPVSGGQLTIGAANTKDVKGWIKDVNDDWCVQSEEIYAKNLGDMVYLRPYVVDYDGTVKYLEVGQKYSPALYAYDILNSKTNGVFNEPEGERKVCAALLQYGAAAQLYFDYEEDSLVTDIPEKYTNAKLSEYNLEYNASYSDALNTDNVKELADTLNRGEIKNNEIITRHKIVLDLVGAIRLHVGYNIDSKVIDWDNVEKAEVLFWNEDDFERIMANENEDERSLEYKYNNYSYKCDLLKATGEEPVYVGDYIAQSDYILAKYIGETVYATCRIQMKDNGLVYNSGVAVYSPDAFAKDQIDNSGSDIDVLCQAIAVYGEMAKNWFVYKIGNNY